MPTLVFLMKFRLEAFLAAGTLGPAECLDRLRQAIGQRRFTLIHVFMGAVPSIACRTAGPDVVSIPRVDRPFVTS